MNTIPIHPSNSDFTDVTIINRGPEALSHEVLRSTFPLAWFLSNAFFLAVLFPYLSPFPIPTDIQPLAFSLSLLTWTLTGILRRHTFDHFDWIFLGFSILSLLYINPNLVQFDFFYFRKATGLGMAFLVFFVAKQYHAYFSPQLLFYSCIFFAALVAFQLFFHDAYATTFAHFFMFRYFQDGGTFGYRGFTGPCPEPSFLVYSAIFFMLMIHFFKQRDGTVPPFSRTIFVLSLFFLIGSKSGTGLVVGFLIMVIWLYKRYGLPKTIIAFLFVFSIAAVLAKSNNQSRAIKLLNMLATDPALLWDDESIMDRVNIIILGGLSLLHYPFGNGDLLCFDTYKELFFHYKMQEWHSQKVLNFIWITMRQGGVNELGRYSIRMGLIFWSFMGYLAWKLTRREITSLPLIYLICCLGISMPIIYPPMWFLIGIHMGLKKAKESLKKQKRSLDNSQRG